MMKESRAQVDRRSGPGGVVHPRRDRRGWRNACAAASRSMPHAGRRAVSRRAQTKTPSCAGRKASSRI